MAVTPEQLAQWKALAERFGQAAEIARSNISASVTLPSRSRDFREVSIAVPALIEALEQAQRDTERLDWLGNQGNDIEVGAAFLWGAGYDDESFREAIDAAMARVSPPSEERW
jgi:hypothetical protein